MPFIVDDAFYEFAREHRLPDCAVSFLMLAGSWSARNSRSGFVPAVMLADFSSDPDQVKRTLCAAGLLERAEGGGWWITEGNGVTVVNAADAEAMKAKVREGGKERAQRFRDRRKAGRAQAIQAALPETPGPGDGERVTRYAAASSRVTPQIDRSDLSIGVGQSKSDARARESPKLVTAVADAICAKVGYVPTDEQALAVIDAIRERARKAGKRIRSPLAYIPAAVTNEPDLYAGLLDGDPPPVSAIGAKSTADHGERHEYDLDPLTGVCRCSYTKTSPRHNVARAG
jgi:hypothetical protein